MGFNFICAILESILAGFANSPFFGIIVGFLNAFLSAFGCNIISPG